MNAGSRPQGGAVPRVDWHPRAEPPKGDALPMGAMVGIALLCVAAGVGVAFGAVSAVMLAAGAIGCMVVLYDFRVGVVMLILTLPISASDLFPHELFGLTGLNPMNLLMMGTLVSCAVHVAGDRRLKGIVPAELAWLYVAPLVLAAMLGMRHVGEIASAFFQMHEVSFYDAGGYLRDLLLKPMFLVLFSLLIAAGVLKTQRPERLLIPMVVSIWVMCLLVIIYVATANVSLSQLAGVYARQFLTPLGIHANDLGRLYAVAYGLVLFTWAESKDSRLTLPLVATMGLLVIALLLTFSRGAFLGFLIVNGLFVVWRASARTVVGALLIGAALAVLLPGAVLVRVQLGLGSGFDLDAMTAGRWNNIWLPIFDELANSPLWGNGLHSILWAEPMRSGQMFRVTHPHSAYLEVLLDMGLIGFALLCGYFLKVWKGFRALSRDQALSPELRGFFQGAAAGLIALAIANIAGSTLYPAVEQVYLWMAIGVMYGLRLRRPARASTSSPAFSSAATRHSR